MLIPGTIPKQEPLIRVGIILPEDRYTSLSVLLPAIGQYQMNYSGRTLLPSPGSQIFFKRQNGSVQISIDEQNYSAPNEIKLFPQNEKQTPFPKSGIIFKNVISGRDFHWKKYVDLSYEGTLIIRKHEDRLLVINELPLEQYLMCVATSEMGAASPKALIEAQTITARSWMLANVEQKHIELGMDVCNDDCCQRYQGTTFLSEQSITGAVNTSGKVLVYKDKICDARYSKSCGGVMETFETIWPGDPRPYLQSKVDAEENLPEYQAPLSSDLNFTKWLNAVPRSFCSPHTVPEEDLHKYLGSVDETGHYFRWQVTLTQTDLIENLKRYHPVKPAEVSNIVVSSRGLSGRAKKVIVKYRNFSGNSNELILDNEFGIRQSLHKSFLYSSAFEVQKETNGDFTLKGAGWGHGVGLCQIGALGMSLQNYTSEQIMLHYFPGSILKKIY